MFGYHSVGEVIEDIKKELPASLGKRLISVIHFGPHVHDDPKTRIRFSQASMRVLIVVSDMSSETLDLLAEAWNEVKSRRIITPMVMTPDEISASTDVFPITFLEIQRSHETIVGTDVVQGLDVSHVHLRLRCEQELKNLVLRMQSAFLTGQRSNEMSLSLVRAHESFTRAVGAALLFAGQTPPSDNEEMLMLAAEQFSFDLQLVNQVNELATKGRSLDSHTLKALYVSFLQLVHQTAERVDQMPVKVLYVIDD